MPSPSREASKGSLLSNDAAMDPRFATMHRDPRFRPPPRNVRRVKLDRRFGAMMRDAEFARKAPVDRYGRPVDPASGRRELQRLYEPPDEDEEDGEEGEDDEDEDEDEVGGEVDWKSGLRKGYDPAREGGFDTSSDEDEGDSDQDVELEDLSADMGEGDALLAREEEVQTGEVSSRLAAVNLDWDHIRAVDLMAVANSFVPAGGKILNVVVYPSEFGRERLKKESVEGPPKEFFAGSKRAKSNMDEESDEEQDEEIKNRLVQEDEGEEYSSSELRAYQLSRLRYYYAVLNCSSPATAKALYDAMDGREYLSTSNFFDLRFVPDEISFDEDEPRDECTQAPDGYKPNDFVTEALTHSKVKLTWDAEDSARKEVQKRAFSRGEIEENDLKAYIGSDSSDPEDDKADSESGTNPNEPLNESEDLTHHMSKKTAAEAKRRRLREALGLSSKSTDPGGGKSESEPKAGNLQITFTPGFQVGADSKRTVFKNGTAMEETTREKYIRKEKERKERRKERAKLAHAAADREAASDVEGSEDRIDRSKTENLIADEGPIDETEDPFDDPFFDDPEASRRAEMAAQRANKRKKQAKHEAEGDVKAAQRSQLELLMVDDEAVGGQVQHFDMKEIARAEKARKRKGKKQTTKNGRVDQAEQASFSMNVQDPRFADLYSSHEFAIDPTNPRYKPTEGMRALLEEGRRKRKSSTVDDARKSSGKTGSRSLERPSADEVARIVRKLRQKH